MKINQYESNDFYIKNLKNLRIQCWKMASQEIGFRRESGFAEKLVSQGNLFLVTLAKIFIVVFVVKQIIMQNVVALQFCDLGKKKHQLEK